MPRPDVAPRPVCRYFNTPRGCFAGAKCHYLHGDPAIQKYAPYEEHKTCRFYAQGYCKRGVDCWFRHVAPEATSVASPSLTRQSQGPSVTAEDASCAICYEEKPVLYGLLSGCSHAFCLLCIRRWRDPEGKGTDMQESGTHKTCPMCRVATKYIVPASRFYPQGDSRKAELMENYKQSMAKVPCRYFIRSKPTSRFCPFGCDCFYQHANADGTPYEFDHGVDVMMPQWQERRRAAERSNPSNNLFRADALEAALEVLEGLAGTFSDQPGQSEENDRNALARSTMREMHDYVISMMEFDSFLRPESEETSEEPGQETEEPEDELHIRGGTHSEDGTEASLLPELEPVPSSPLVFSRAHTEDPSDLDFHSDDPRSPDNASRSGQLTTGDFAWMMEERREEGCEHNLSDE